MNCSQIYPTQISCIVPNAEETFLFIGTRTGEIFAADLRNRHYVRLPAPEKWWWTDGLESISFHGNKIVGLTRFGRMMSWNLTTFEMMLPRREQYVWARIPTEKLTTLNAEIEHEKIFRIPEGEDGAAMSVRHSPNGEKLAVTTSKSKMFIVDAESMTVTKTIDIGTCWNHDALFSNSGGWGTPWNRLSEHVFPVSSTPAATMATSTSGMPRQETSISASKDTASPSPELSTEKCGMLPWTNSTSRNHFLCWMNFLWIKTVFFFVQNMF